MRTENEEVLRIWSRGSNRWVIDSFSHRFTLPHELNYLAGLT